MTELRQRMLDAMVQRGFSQSTQTTYVGAIRRMAKHYRRDPATYTVRRSAKAPRGAGRSIGAHGTVALASSRLPAGIYMRYGGHLFLSH